LDCGLGGWVARHALGRSNLIGRLFLSRCADSRAATVQGKVLGFCNHRTAEHRLELRAVVQSVQNLTR
jgi:hypothetical protein